MMSFRWNPREHAALAVYVVKWLTLAVPVGAVIGVAVAVFLFALQRATEIRWATDLPGGVPWTLFLLPLAGVGVGGLYYLFGKSVEAGNNLIMEQIHEPGGGVPGRMAPLVLIGTVITHLFGGSAGREGTAVQMGGSLASVFARWMKLPLPETRILLMCGIAGGFGAVFGTPLTGAIFALEVLAIGRVDFQSMTPCLMASVSGDFVTRWILHHLGIEHTAYHIGTITQTGLLQHGPQLQWILLAKVMLASAAFGLASVCFAELSRGLSRLFKAIVPWPPLKPALGGIFVILLTLLLGTDYLGLGVTADLHHPQQVCIASCFHDGGANAFSWLWKILFTVITLASGFKGGEVTPLFFIGAALGNTMAHLLNAPVDLFAGLGFVAVFAGATNTPLACTIMGVELFAAGNSELIHSGLIVYLATACFVAYLMSGHSSIYTAQRMIMTKGGLPISTGPDSTPAVQE